MYVKYLEWIYGVQKNSIQMRVTERVEKLKPLEARGYKALPQEHKKEIEIN